MPSFRILGLALGVCLLGGTAASVAQQEPKLDAGVTFIAERSLKANTSQNFWMEGGSIELGANVWKGWGIAADVTGTHTNSVGNSSVPLSMITTTFGPRYRWQANKKWSVYGEGLIGEANVFHTLVPTPSGADTSGNSLAIQVGGGLDYALKQRFAIRLLDAGWIRTQVPNSTNSVQNTLRLGAGVVVRFGH